MFEVGETAFAPGDALLLYSDGVSEAMDMRDQEYAEDRLRALWQSSAGVATRDIPNQLIQDVVKFRGTQGPERRHHRPWSWDRAPSPEPAGPVR